MAGGDHVDYSTQNSESSQTSNEEINNIDSPTNLLQEHLGEVTHDSNKDPKKELEVLWRRIKTTATLLTYLKTKARKMTNPSIPLSPCGTSQLDEIEKWIAINALDEHDGVYIDEVVKSVQLITDSMQSLLKRVKMAESETAIEKQKVRLSQEEIIKKEIQIEIMSEKLDEMDRFAVDTNCVLNEMRQWVDSLVEETSRQRQRATENEEELIRVKRDFESLKSYVNSLISVRETLVSSEKQFQNMEKLFERLVVKTTQLETEKKQKETEIQKLMEENLKLNALLDRKEAQLIAMNEQCKVMALSASKI